MPPDAKSPQPGKSAPQDDENLPKVKKTEHLSVVVNNVFISSHRNIFSTLTFVAFP